jgi:hypothetical protein
MHALMLYSEFVQPDEFFFLLQACKGAGEACPLEVRFRFLNLNIGTTSCENPVNTVKRLTKPGEKETTSVFRKPS